MRWIVMAAVLGVAGCAQQRIAEAEAAVTTKVAECKAQYGSADTNFLLKARCEESARRVAFQARGAPGDLVGVVLATRADIAARLDRKEITKEEANLRMAQTLREVTDTQLSRRNAALAAEPPPPLQIAPTTTNCTRFGNTVRCNSY